MQTEINGSPSFSYIKINLDPGESIYSESGAMTSMDSDLDMKAKMNGNFFSAIGKKFLGQESFFISRFTNNTEKMKMLVLTQSTPGEIREIDLSDDSFCLQPGAYICSTTGLKLSVNWAGFRSWIAREGLFRLKVKGTGKLWYGAFGSLIEKQIQGAYIVDTSHLVAYEPQIKLRIKMAGGFFSSLFSGEGLVSRLEGHGKIVIQTRSLDGLASWLKPSLL